MNPIHHVFQTKYLKETKNKEFRELFRVFPTAEQTEPNSCFEMMSCISLPPFDFVNFFCLVL